MWETTQTYKSSSPEVFCKKGVLRNFAKITGKHLCQSLLLLTLLPHYCKISSSYLVPVQNY